MLYRPERVSKSNHVSKIGGDRSERVSCVEHLHVESML